MATVVETFIAEETVGLIYDNEQLDNWNRLVNELGLTGQTAIVKPEKSPIPFMFLKANLVNVLETLCPRKVDVKDYDKTPIPLEILDLVALSVKEQYFNKIQIWYDDKTPDPACVGMVGHYYASSWGSSSQLKGREFKTLQDFIDAGGKKGDEYYSVTATYLLGKWADVKRSFQELTEMATKRYISEEGHRYRNQIKEAQRGLDDLESRAFDKFGDSATNSSSDLNLPF